MLLENDNQTSQLAPEVRGTMHQEGGVVSFENCMATFTAGGLLVKQGGECWDAASGVPWTGSPSQTSSLSSKRSNIYDVVFGCVGV